MASKRALLVMCLFVALAISAVFAGNPNNWQGPYNSGWNTAGSWSLGTVPGLADDVTIYSGGSDYVILDASPNTNSLTLGGAANGYNSYLVDDYGAQILSITQSLKVDQTGWLNLHNGSTVTAGADSSNAGYIEIHSGSLFQINGNLDNPGYLDFWGSSTINITGTLTTELSGWLTANGAVTINLGVFNNSGHLDLGQGATMNLANQLNITDIPLGAFYHIWGTLNAGANNAFSNLSSVEGELYLADGKTTNIAPIGGTLAISPAPGSNLAVGGTGTTVNVTGDVVNNRWLTTSYFGGNGDNNTLNISGTLTTSGFFFVQGFGDVANVGTLVNTGAVFIGTGATLNLTKQSSITDVPASSIYQIYGSFTAGGQSALTNLTSIEGRVDLANGQTTDITPGSGVLTLTYPGSLNMSYGSTLNIHGDVTVGGTLDTNASFNSSSDRTALSVDGTLTNNGTLNSHFSSLKAGDIVNNSWLEQRGVSDYGPDVIQTSTLTNNAYVQQNDYGSNQPITIQATTRVVNNYHIYQGGYYGNAFLQTPELDNAGFVNQQNENALGDTILVGTGTAGAAGYYQLANGTLGEFIDMNKFGVITIRNGAPVTLDGTLKVLLQPGYIPGVGSTFDFIVFTPGMLNGMFANIQNALFNNGTEQWIVVYDNLNGHVELQAMAYNNQTPEPASLLLLGSGVLGLGYGMRRRLMK